MTHSCDFQIVDHGSVVMFTPLNLDAQTFAQNELEIDSWQWMGNGFAVDHRIALGLHEYLIDSGFSC
jgi:hypothetical protein